MAPAFAATPAPPPPLPVSSPEAQATDIPSAVLAAAADAPPSMSEFDVEKTALEDAMDIDSAEEGEVRE